MHYLDGVYSRENKQTKNQAFFQLALHNDSLGINVLRLYSKEWKVCTRSRIKILAMNN